MSLMSMPPELLSIILNAVGSAEFRGRVDRLTVCKSWYNIAQAVLLQDLTFNAPALERFPPTSPRARQHLRASVRKLSVQIAGYDDLLASPGLDIWDDNHEKYRLEDWMIETNRNVQNLAMLLPDFTNLKSFTFQALSEYHPDFNVDDGEFLYQPHAWLYAGTVASLLRYLSKPALTTLKLDMRGSPYRGGIGRQLNTHVCPLIALHLPTLCRLHLRLEKLCAEVLDVMDSKKHSRLEVLIINLSLKGQYQSRRHSRPCVSPRRPYNQNFIKKAMDLFIKHTPSLKIARILYHKLPPGDFESGYGVVALDCLKNRMTRLHDGARGLDWEDKGEDIEQEPDDDDEVFDESLEDD